MHLSRFMTIAIWAMTRMSILLSTSTSLDWGGRLRIIVTSSRLLPVGPDVVEEVGRAARSRR